MPPPGNSSGPSGVSSVVPMPCPRLSAYLLAIATGAAFCAGCSDGSSSPSPSTTQPHAALTLAVLRERPLHIENLEAGESCPALRPHDLSPAFAPGLGDGPVYPVGFGKRGVLLFAYPPEKNGLFAGSDWSGQKVLWVSDPKYDGPILIRGRQVDGTNGLRFGRNGPRLLEELAFGAHGAGNWSGGWRNFPSYTRLRAPGCYAYQVDGAGFSDTIVFRASVWASS
jgi:hypothetical protein